MKTCSLCASEGLFLYSVPVGGIKYEITRCPACGHLFRGHAEGELAIHGGAMDTVDDAEFFNNRFLKTVLCWFARCDGARLKKSSGKSCPRLLDIGCGTGWITAQYARCGMIVEGLESSGVRSGHAMRYPEITVHQVSLETFIPADGGAYDVIVLRHVLEHFEDPVSRLRKIRSLLKPGGVLFLVVPNLDGIGARVFKERWDWVLPWHWQFFTPASLRRLLEKEGFDVGWMGTSLSPISYYYTLRSRFPFLGKSVLLSLIVAASFLLAGTLCNKNDVLVCGSVKRP